MNPEPVVRVLVRGQVLLELPASRLVALEWFAHTGQGGVEPGLPMELQVVATDRLGAGRVNCWQFEAPPLPSDE